MHGRSLALLVCTLACLACTPTQSEAEAEAEFVASLEAVPPAPAPPPSEVPPPPPVPESIAEGTSEGTIYLGKRSVIANSFFSASLAIEGPMSLDDARTTMLDGVPALIGCWAD